MPPAAPRTATLPAAPATTLLLWLAEAAEGEERERDKTLVLGWIAGNAAVPEDRPVLALALVVVVLMVGVLRSVLLSRKVSCCDVLRVGGLSIPKVLRLGSLIGLTHFTCVCVGVVSPVSLGFWSQQMAVSWIRWLPPLGVFEYMGNLHGTWRSPEETQKGDFQTDIYFRYFFFSGLHLFDGRDRQSRRERERRRGAGK